MRYAIKVSTKENMQIYMGLVVVSPSLCLSHSKPYQFISLTKTSQRLSAAQQRYRNILGGLGEASYQGLLFTCYTYFKVLIHLIILYIILLILYIFCELFWAKKKYVGNFLNKFLFSKIFILRWGFDSQVAYKIYVYLYL